MKISQKYSLTNDLQEHLINIFSDSELSFFWNNEELYTEDVFKTNCLLPMFLYDKQRFVNEFCAKQFNKKYFSQIILQQGEDSYLNFIVHIEHNFKDKKQYNMLLGFLICLSE